MSTLDMSCLGGHTVAEYKEDDGVGPNVATSLVHIHFAFLVGAVSSPFAPNKRGVHTDLLPGGIAFDQHCTGDALKAQNTTTEPPL